MGHPPDNELLDRTQHTAGKSQPGELRHIIGFRSHESSSNQISIVLEYSSPEPEDDTNYPEGGLRAWMVVVGAWCAMFPPLGMLNTIAALQGWLSEHQLAGMAESKTGWIYSCYAFLITACGAQVGL